MTGNVEEGGTPPVNANTPMPDADRAHELMHIVLEHYVTHHQVVFKKLHHAQKATVESIGELEKLSGKLPQGGGQSLRDIRKYDHMWGAIIEMFKAHGATEDDLERIEEVLLTIPRAIKKYYDVLVEQDKALQGLIVSLNTEEYKKACKIISDVQGKPNPMTGLKQDEYKPSPTGGVISSYKFGVEMLRDRD